MRILVTGATGGLGRNAVEALLQRGIDVHATGRNVEIGRTLDGLGATFTALDLARATPEETRTLLADVDAVWHCAALSSPWGPRSAFEQSNVDATARLVEAAGHRGVTRFVHISTPALYFDYTHRHGIVESFRAARPVNDYARTKALAETVVREAGARFPAMRTAILRPRAIFGPHDQVLIPRLTQLMRQHDGRLPLPRGGRTVIDVTYAGNVVHAMWLATTKDDLPSGLAFNITNDQPERVAVVLEKLFVGQLGHAMRIRALPYPLIAGAAAAMECAARFTGEEPRLTRYSVGVLAYDMTLDLSRARAVLGYAPPVSLDEGIDRTAAWLRRNG